MDLLSLPSEQGRVCSLSPCFHMHLLLERSKRHCCEHSKAYLSYYPTNKQFMSIHTMYLLVQHLICLRANNKISFFQFKLINTFTMEQQPGPANQPISSTTNVLTSAKKEHRNVTWKIENFRKCTEISIHKKALTIAEFPFTIVLNR